MSTRFRGVEDKVHKLGALGAWLCCVLMIGLGVSPAAVAQTTVTYIHTDALGSVVAESDANGNVIKRYDYEPYGAVAGGEVTDGPGYTGHVSDSATGLSYMQQRYMDPQLGVFLSVDPVTAYEQPVGQFNRYRYAAGNPYRYFDPDGRAESPAWMRYTIPGQMTWDAAVTSAEQGNYGMAAAGGVVAIAEGVMGIVTLGQSQRVTLSGQLASKEIAAMSAARSASAEAQASKAAEVATAKPVTIQTNPKNLIPTQTKSEMSGSQVKRMAADMRRNGYDQSKPVDAIRNERGRLELKTDIIELRRLSRRGLRRFR
ncbi:RHS repeat-associated core domain-containing protein [Stenotrophomonas sp.]|uniref:RHS repeat domain-containing protein n=1 Tax=Stenotrophomonas sp. TaxID=69392 RepID=UPI0028AB0692|nr:RHS repeat-associated core domain-containing protein [Stenotrophomonas sp.]